MLCVCVRVVCTETICRRMMCMYAYAYVIYPAGGGLEEVAVAASNNTTGFYPYYAYHSVDGSIDFRPTNSG